MEQRVEVGPRVAGVAGCLVHPRLSDFKVRRSGLDGEGLLDESIAIVKSANGMA